MRLKLFFSSALVLMMGCEGGTTFSNTIDNQSDSDLLVIVHTNSGFIDIKTIPNCLTIENCKALN